MIRYIRPLPKRSDPLIRRVYAQVRQDFGFVADPISLHSPSPPLLAGFWTAFRETLLAGAVARHRKEVVAATVSRFNQCPYCVDSHALMLEAAGRKEVAQAIIAGREEGIQDHALRATIAWAAATRTPGSPILADPPFSRREAPELIGTAVVFHYLNRMATVFLEESPMPVRNRLLQGLMWRGLVWFVSRDIGRPRRPGASLALLQAAPLPEDLVWASSSAEVAGAFSRWAAVADGIEERRPGVSRVLREVLERWEGGEPPLGRSWLEEAVATAQGQERAAAVLAVLVALAPHRVGPDEVESFRRQEAGDRPLLELVSWAALAAARRIGLWLPGPGTKSLTTPSREPA